MFKDRIKELREKNNLSRAEFAKTIHVSAASVSFYESGKQKPGTKTINNICKTFDVNENWLLGDERSGAGADTGSQKSRKAKGAQKKAKVLENTADETSVSGTHSAEEKQEPAGHIEETLETEAEVNGTPGKMINLSTKGEKKMSKKTIGEFMMPMPFSPYGKATGERDKQGSDMKAKAEELMKNYKNLLQKYQQENTDAYKAFEQDRKDKFEQAFGRFIEMQETFADFLPEDPFVLPFLPMYSLFPKKAMKQFMEFERLSNEHFKKQTDLLADYREKRKAIFNDMIAEAVAKNGENDEKE